MGWRGFERPPYWTRLGVPLGGLLAIATLAIFLDRDDVLLAPTALETAAISPQRALVELASAADAAEATRAPDRVDRLRSGQTLGAVFASLGLDGGSARDAAEACARFVNLRQLRPGSEYSVYFEDEALERFDLELDGKGVLTLRREAEGWTSEFRACQRETRIRSVRGVLEGALESSIVRAGGAGELAYAMSDALQWDLDFTRDLRNGDRFSALFEEVWLDGEYRGVGNVLALSYDRGGKELQVFRFGDGDGFYDADGRPLVKMFLRSPLPYSRVTSRFSRRRFHPVLKTFRPHYGVDYGAPVGTPVRVTASGTVVSAGWDGGGGKTVKVRHPNGYLTAYLHLSKFAAGLHAGDRVAQGEVIGYVGATGLASGPHLDYRVQQNGHWIDPLSIRSVPGEPLSKLQLAEFRAVRDEMLASLATGAPYEPRELGSPTGGDRLATSPAPPTSRVATRR
ncbi:MAG: peptidoglycan DD-metalloendopeptidase family protein [Acidobacteria bacterium]|nr:peptidoglycan DD-metalloendopeptidase family protein [Acidobacteriota bacterium]MCB9377521.1 peptidoglycan DD-metalloendopeptidase family protein [Holophagales bacterium]